MWAKRRWARIASSGDGFTNTAFDDNAGVRCFSIFITDAETRLAE
jgi:hypothetical protein